AGGAGGEGGGWRGGVGRGGGGSRKRRPAGGGPAGAATGAGVERSGPVGRAAASAACQRVRLGARMVQSLRHAGGAGVPRALPGRRRSLGVRQTRRPPAPRLTRPPARPSGG